MAMAISYGGFLTIHSAYNDFVYLLNKYESHGEEAIRRESGGVVTEMLPTISIPVTKSDMVKPVPSKSEDTESAKLQAVD